MKCPIKNNSDYDMEAHTDLVDSLFSHANQELGFNKPPTLIFQSDPRNYGVLSKTAQYDPSTQEITIYVDGRHMKDILRSFAHELVHHHQNEQGRLSGANVTQGEQDFDDIEGEAYHTGNLKLFRKWEDGIKQKNPTIYNERRIYKMSTKKWKNKELSNLITEKFGFKMDLKKLNESVQEEQLEEAVEEIEEDVEQLEEAGACAEEVEEEKLEEEEVNEEEEKLEEGVWDAVKGAAKGIGDFVMGKGKWAGLDHEQWAAQADPQEVMRQINLLKQQIEHEVGRQTTRNKHGTTGGESTEPIVQQYMEKIQALEAGLSANPQSQGGALEEDLKEWKNKELSNNLNEKFGFKMDLNKLLK